MAAAPGAPAPPAAARPRGGTGDLAARRLGELLDALASTAPAPAGGAAAALAGALGAALCAMVARVAAAHDGGRPPLLPMGAAADRVRGRLARLAAADAAAYARYVAARRRRPAAPASVERALVTATEVPVAVGEAARDALVLCRAVAPRARPSTRADLAVAVHLARAALAAAAVTARANAAVLAAAAARPLARRLDRAEREGASAAAAALARLGVPAGGAPAAAGAGRAR